jgi:phospholipid-translocating ATPase
VTPVIEEDGTRAYQAASPDEIALVKFTERVGLTLHDRTQRTITLVDAASGEADAYRVLNCFPFTSEAKRMGIVVQRQRDQSITFYMKGAESVMLKLLRDEGDASDWLLEETDNMAREGLRTLVFAAKQLSHDEYADFSRRYDSAQRQMQNREAQLAAVQASLEQDLSLLGLSGVEDRLQDGVKTTLETLRQAGIKVGRPIS